MGVVPSVVISDGEMCRELFKHPALNGRTKDASMDVWIEETAGLFMIDDNKRWRLSRKNAVKALSLFSTSKNSKLSASVVGATDAFKVTLEEREGQALDLRDDVFGLTNAVVMDLVFGKESDQNDPDLRKIVKWATGLLDEMQELMVLQPLPFLTPFFKGKIAKQREGLVEFRTFMMNLFEEHIYDGEVRTIADAIKKASADITDEELAECEMTRNHLHLVALDLYTAGMFDTAENTHWFLVLLAAHPEIQDRLVSEIKDLTGGSRAVVSADQTDLVYTWASLLESLRYACTAPVGMPHCTTADVQFRQWTIPKGTQVVPNTWVINFNPEVFPEPKSYKPERFIKNGIIDANMSNSIFIFGHGGRRCIGEAFAKQEIFVSVANIIQDFRIELDPDTPGNPLEHSFRFTLQPGPHKLIFRRR